MRNHPRAGQSELYYVSWWYLTLVIDLIGQLSRDVISRLPVRPWRYWLWRLVMSLVRFDPAIVKVKLSFIVSQTVSCPVGQLTIWLKTINWRDATHFDSEDYYSTGCRNVIHCEKQQSYSGLRSPRRSYSAYLWIINLIPFRIPLFSFWLPCLVFLSCFSFLFYFHKFMTCFVKINE